MLHRELLERYAENEPIRVGASAQGWLGRAFVTQLANTPGMVLNVLAHPDPAVARQMFLDTGLPADRVVEAQAAGPATDALRAGKRVVTASYTLLAQLEDVDIVADATYSPAVGAEVAYHSLQQGKDVVLLNIEADVTVGRVLKRMADDMGVLYTVASGDEPGCLLELYDFVRVMGMQVIVAGKGKSTPLQPNATPDTVAEQARASGNDPYQIAYYVDGTKTMLEMACVANATGCLPMQRGMTGPAATLENISQIFALRQDGGTAAFPGVVDYVQGPAMAGGVFITARVNDPRIRADLQYLKGWHGPYFTFFRPYHLGPVEAPLSIARAHLYLQPTLVPLDQPVAEVLAIAKRDLQPGDQLDDFGGYTTYGLIERANIARQLNALPIGLTPGATMVRFVPAGDILTWADVNLDESSILVKLRRQQDRMVS